MEDYLLQNRPIIHSFISVVKYSVCADFAEDVVEAGEDLVWVCDIRLLFQILNHVFDPLFLLLLPHILLLLRHSEKLCDLFFVILAEWVVGGKGFLINFTFHYFVKAGEVDVLLRWQL